MFVRSPLDARGFGVVAGDSLTPCCDELDAGVVFIFATEERAVMTSRSHNLHMKKEQKSNRFDSPTDTDHHLTKPYKYHIMKYHLPLSKR